MMPQGPCMHFEDEWGPYYTEEEWGDILFAKEMAIRDIAEKTLDNSE